MPGRPKTGRNALRHGREPKRQKTRYVQEREAHQLRTPWSEEYKAKVVNHVLSHGVIAASARKFDVPYGTLRRWLDQYREDNPEVRDLRVAARVRATSGAWGSLNKLIDRLHRRLDQTEGGVACPQCGAIVAVELGGMTTPELTQAVLGLSKVVDNLGDVTHKFHLEGSVANQRRGEDEELEAWERRQGLLPPGTPHLHARTRRIG